MDTAKLKSVAQQMLAERRGLLAIDESMGTIKKRFDSIHVESTEENRRSYREMLITAKGLGKYISGAILFDETIRQKTKDGTTFVDILKKQGILPGIKVDKGAKTLAAFPGEKVTEGLDGLRERFQEYNQLGAQFSKWRAVITIGEYIPSDVCIHANAHALARYAALSQEADIVPVVEPEVLMDGDHSIETCFEVTSRTLKEVFEELKRMKICLEGMVLKPNMVLSGKDCPVQADVRTVAEMTVKCLIEYLPAEVPGCAFLSGGQTNEQATLHLNAINKIENLPWRLTFSYGRALQSDALKAWAGDNANNPSAQEALLKLAENNSKASAGEYE